MLGRKFVQLAEDGDPVDQPGHRPAKPGGTLLKVGELGLFGAHGSTKDAAEVLQRPERPQKVSRFLLLTNYVQSF
jgi:hypothetical protein